MKRYEKYVETGNRFFPMIPERWQVKLGLSCFSENKEKNSDLQNKTQLQFKYGTIIKKQSQEITPEIEETLKKYTAVYPHDIILNGLNLNYDFVSQRIGLVEETGAITSAYLALQCRRILNPYYATYLLKSFDSRKIFHGMGTGIRLTLGFSEFKNIKFPVPPREEQDQIVRFLDYKISKINSLIKGYQKQIKLLKERRANVIELAVTQGIDDSVELKDSGAHWLPKIPKHWNMIPSKWLFAESKQKKLPDDVPATASQQFGIISQVDYMNKIGRRIVVANQGLDDWKHVEPNDFVISLRSFQGGLERSDITGCVTWHYIVLIPQKNVNPDYFKWLLKSKSYIKALQGTSDYIRDGQDLRYSDFVKVSLPVIPYEEQQAIADFISDKVAEIDNAIPRINAQIDLLKEYRTRLISDVVTGQIDVRDEVIPECTAVEDEPEQTEENEENNLLEDGEENI